MSKKSAHESLVRRKKEGCERLDFILSPIAAQALKELQKAYGETRKEIVEGLILGAGGFNSHVAAWRKMHGMTREDAAEKLGCTVTQIRRWEGGEQWPFEIDAKMRQFDDEIGGESPMTACGAY